MFLHGGVQPVTYQPQKPPPRLQVPPRCHLFSRGTAEGHT